MSRRVRNSLLVSWVAVSVVLFVARHWQLRALHTVVQHHISAALLHKDLWSLDSTHISAAATNAPGASVQVVLHTDTSTIGSSSLSSGFGVGGAVGVVRVKKCTFALKTAGSGCL
jgi:hypothetical protein